MAIAGPKNAGAGVEKAVVIADNGVGSVRA